MPDQADGTNKTTGKSKEENRKVKCDIAMVPIGGTYTMDAKQAAQLVNEIRPTIVIPVHYGSVAGKKDDADRFAALVDKDIQVEIQQVCRRSLPPQSND